MNRQEAIYLLSKGNSISKDFTEEDGVSRPLSVMIRIEKICNFPRHKQVDHNKIGPIHLRFLSGTFVYWIHITPEQLTNFIIRNYSE